MRESVIFEGSRVFFGGLPRFGALAPLSVFEEVERFLVPPEEDEEDVLWEENEAEGT